MIKFLLNMSVADDVVAGISDWFMGKLYSILLFLDGIVYYLVSVFYQIFNKVAQVQLFSRSTDGGSSQFEMLTNRIYSILGIVMLFVLAYNILKLIINPDTLDDKSDSSMLGIIKNLIISLIIVALLPTGFNYLQRIQNRVLDTNVLSRIVFGASIDTNTSSTDSSTDNSSKDGIGGVLDNLLSKYKCSNPSNGSFDSKYAGYDLSITIFTAFFHPVIDGKTYTYNDCKSNTSDLLCASYVRAVDNSLVCGNMNMLRSTIFIDEIGNKMEYLPVISTAAGIVAAYLLLSFALDMGVRVAKLGILQLIAPVPVILRITKPKGGAFDKWLKELSKTYLMVFERLLVIYFALFTIQLLCSENGPIASVFSGSENGFIKLIAFVIVILGVLQFAKDAPKLIEELFSIKVPQMSIKRKLNENEYGKRAAVGAGALGAGVAKWGWNRIASFVKGTDQYDARLKRKDERDAFKARRDTYRQNLSGIGKAADTAVHAASVIAGGVGTALRTTARGVGTVARGVAAGNVDIDKLGDTIGAQASANEKRYEEQNIKRTARRQRAIKNRFNTGSYVFPSVQGAVAEWYDSVPDKEGVLDQNGNPVKDYGSWVVSKINTALKTSTTAKVSADKALIAEAKGSVDRITGLKGMKAKDDEIKAEKAARESAVYNTTQQSVLEQTINYNNDISAVNDAATLQKRNAVSNITTTYNSVFEQRYKDECIKIDNDVSLTAEAKASAKKQLELDKEQKITRLNSSNVTDVIDVVKNEAQFLIDNINNDTTLSDAEKRVKITQVKQNADNDVRQINDSYSTVDANTAKATADLTNKYNQAISAISAAEAKQIADIKADTDSKKYDAKVTALNKDRETLRYACSPEVTNEILSDIRKMNDVSQAAIYNNDMRKLLNLTPTASLDECQAALDGVFSDIRGNDPITVETIKILEQLGKSMASAYNVSELAAFNSNKKESSGEKKK